MKTFLTTVLLLIFNLSIGQNSVANYNKFINPTNNNNYQILSNHNNDKLIKPAITTTNDKKAKNIKSIKMESYSEKEWRKIRKQIKRNKKRLSYKKGNIYSTKKIDTIYIHPRKESLLSGW